MRPRNLDPSLLEGDELDRWYRRSPAELDAEREAARTDRYNSFFVMPDERDASDSIEAEAPNLSVLQQGDSWQEARYVRPPPGPVVRPGGARVGRPPAVVIVPGEGPAKGSSTPTVPSQTRRSVQPMSRTFRDL